MPWRLRDNLYWCVSGGRPIFLDVDADRYFCLSPSAAQAFERFSSGHAEPTDLEALGELVDDGLLIYDSRTTTSPSASWVPPATSDLSIAPRSPFNVRAALRVIGAEIMIDLLLRVSTLARVVERCSGRPITADAPCDMVELQRVVRASWDASFVLRATDRCLVRALAVHWLCRRRGFDTKLIFGVRTNPFGAHAWVQLGEQVVVGEFEQARLYAPIAMFG